MMNMDCRSVLTLSIFTKLRAPSKSFPTIWEVPDDLWERIEWLLNEHYPPKPRDALMTAPARFLTALSFASSPVANGITSGDSFYRKIAAENVKEQKAMAKLG
jgi:hypothetical protein